MRGVFAGVDAERGKYARRVAMDGVWTRGRTQHFKHGEAFAPGGAVSTQRKSSTCYGNAKSANVSGEASLRSFAATCS
eukprot:2903641-Alexandrium_andersonii.AAC.1